MRRTIRLLLLCMLLGFGVAVAAGWFIGATRSADATLGDAMRASAGFMSQWSFESARLDAFTSVGYWHNDSHNVDINPASQYTYLLPGPHFKVLARVEMGFPFRSHTSTLLHDTYGRMAGLNGVSRYNDSTLWPEAILPVGLAANAGVYGAAIFALVLAIRGLWSLRHRRHDRCAVCGYVLAGLRGGRCPECGGAG